MGLDPGRPASPVAATVGLVSKDQGRPGSDQLTQAVIVGLCLAQAAVLLVLALVP